jgi:predicted transcriptional regulator
MGFAMTIINYEIFKVETIDDVFEEEGLFKYQLIRNKEVISSGIIDRMKGPNSTGSYKFIYFNIKRKKKGRV